MITAIVGISTAIAVLLATILGYKLNERSTRRREVEATKRQIRSVRTVVNLEIEENLRLLWLLRQWLYALPDGVDPEPMNMARRLIQAPASSWSHKAWENQMPWVQTALTYREIRRVHVHHSRLERITAIRARLETFAAEQATDRASARDPSSGLMATMHVSYAFDWNAAELWEECVRTISEVFETGNPVSLEMEDAQD